MFNLVCLLNPYADPHAVDRRLYQYALFLIAGHRKGIQYDFGRRLGLDFGDIVSF